jgi:hypothetical protein
MQLTSNAQRFIQIIGKIPMFAGLPPPTGAANPENLQTVILRPKRNTL